MKEEFVIPTGLANIVPIDWGSDSSIYGVDAMRLGNSATSRALSEAGELAAPIENEGSSHALNIDFAWRLQDKQRHLQKSSTPATGACCSTASGALSDRTDYSSGACDTAEWVAAAHIRDGPCHARSAEHCTTERVVGPSTVTLGSRLQCQLGPSMHTLALESQACDDLSVAGESVASTVKCVEDSSPQELRTLRQKASELGRRLQERERQCLALKSALEGCGLSVAAPDKVGVPRQLSTAHVGGS